MMASFSPDDNSSKPKDASEASGFIYDHANAPAPAESGYVPEREFVLMPLFRRFGEMLGIRREPEPEYIYQGEELAPETLHQPEPQHRSDLGDNETSCAREETVPAEPKFAAVDQQLEPVNQFHEQKVAEPLPSVAPAVPEPIVFETAATEPESPVLESPAEATGSHFEAPARQPIIPPLTPVEYEQAAEVAQASSAAAQKTQAQKTPARRPDELDEAIAMLREAGSKISAAVSEAIEWLSAKENELVLKAERSLGPAPKTRRVASSSAARSTRTNRIQRRSSSPAVAASDSERIPESEADPKWEPLAFPSLQREVAWKEQGGPALAEQPEARPMRQATNQPPVPRPTLVHSSSKVPFWKRFNWAGQFTPKRVAVLGGLTMAILLVLGVSLARRPASEVLPPQPRPIQPRGVTVTTYPVTNPHASQPHRTPAPAQHAVAPRTQRASRAAKHDEEPEVVTHYYKAKPSPSKQATVAGVKHYSDME
ncbi:MAG: hypothetical protein DMG64_03505 [Acidobacteria bacterium]|nr:MAG: hypothetical protein DMG64_03505 [Acidobacteriota bacterium]